MNFSIETFIKVTKIRRRRLRGLRVRINELGLHLHGNPKNPSRQSAPKLLSCETESWFWILLAHEMNDSVLGSPHSQLSNHIGG